ncbi:undecaprenyl-diphosphate phosphatase [Panacibacter ginsenosidivorans]|uniref:Undecaprenyl-diphosphatase n=1 Tax=Panacibacter ginsenosidivorans TaxID=1813871 RepID=A0A5B8VBE0_9BACT|nr:undecaprenyl-diphosphate phosphatase [Panacibacter ginsenosidivorans]QEC68810.1 undecaprenyl-diphosphate phosphatase [Panacibacter ginsenosidivorans]
MSTIQAVVLAIVEGLTEFLPISSTGHMVMVSSLMGIGKEDFTKFFEIAIQLGAILAVVVLYWRKFINFKSWKFYAKLIVGVIPALIFGKLLSNTIDELLMDPTYTALAILGGGVILLFIDNMFYKVAVKEEKDITFKNAIIIGLCQCAALIPGVSRSAASIIGGLQQKLSRKLAAEFSFFLAVPTMAAATGYKLWEILKLHPEALHNSANLKSLLVGNVVAFVIAFLTMRFFVDFLKKHGFRFFGWYRICAGLIFLLMVKMNQIR